MEARSRAIEEKRRRLEEMKKRKAARAAESSVTATRDEAAVGKAAELRSYVDGLLAQKKGPLASPESKDLDSTGEEFAAETGIADAEASPPEAPFFLPGKAPPEPAPPPPPPPVEAYEKSTQTLAVEKDDEDDNEKAAEAEKTEEEGEDAGDDNPVDPDDRVHKETTAEDLGAFLAHSSRLVERCLGERRVFDALRETDAVAARLFERADESDGGVEAVVATFDAAQWCDRKVVTAVEWSPRRGDVVLAAYARGGGDHAFASSSAAAAAARPGEYDGSVLLWSMARPSTPEGAFACQAAVLCATWDAANPSVLVGGTSSGQVVLWDVRSPSTLPVQRSPLDADAPHTRAVSCIRAKSSDLLTTASTDGVLCSWSTAQLQRPVDTQCVADNGAPLAITALEHGDATNDAAELLVGDERGEIFATRCGRGDASSGAALDAVGTGRAHQKNNHNNNNAPLRFGGHGGSDGGHFGAVTALKAHPSAHPSAHQRDILDAGGLRRSLVLSGSIDWTAQLWSINGDAVSKLATFEHKAHEYVCDVEWSPTRAAILATATSAGDLCLWHALHPSAPLRPPRRVAAAALTRLAWSTDGFRIACGDSKGNTRVLKLNENLASHDVHDDAKLETALRNNSN